MSASLPTVDLKELAQRVNLFSRKHKNVHKECGLWSSYGWKPQGPKCRSNYCNFASCTINHLKDVAVLFNCSYILTLVTWLCTHCHSACYIKPSFLFVSLLTYFLQHNNIYYLFFFIKEWVVFLLKQELVSLTECYTYLCLLNKAIKYFSGALCWNHVDGYAGSDCPATRWRDLWRPYH